MSTLSTNLLYKHPRAEKTYYVNLDFMPVGVTAVSATGDTEDASLGVDSVTVLDEDITVDESQGCAGDQLITGRALIVHLSDGVSDDDEVIVTVEWVQSDGDVDARDCRLVVSGAA